MDALVQAYRSTVWGALAAVGVDRESLLLPVLLLSVASFVCVLHFLYMMLSTLDGIPGPVPWPLLGNLPYYADPSRLHVTLSELHRALGPVVRLWVGPDQIISVQDPKALKRILSTELQAYDRSSKEISHLEDFLGGGIILQPNGEGWKTQRRVLSPAFKHDSLRASLDVVVEQLQPLLATCDAAAVSGEVVDMEVLFQKFTFGIICALTGMPVSACGPLELPHELEAFNYLCSHSQFRIFCPLKYWKVYKTAAVRRFDSELAFLKGRVVEQLEATAPGDDIMGCLAGAVKDGSLTQASAVQQVLTLLFAGHDTTSNMLSFVLYYLATDDDERERVEAEVADVVGAGPLQYEQLAQLEYTACALKETLRLRPSAPARSRELTIDTVLLGEKLGARTSVAWSAYAMHHDPELWPSPEDFEPSRFLEHINPFAFLPFGAGPRRCIGEPLALLVGRVALATLLRRYKFTCAPGQTDDASMALTLRPRHGMRVFVARK